jgi:8-oxo-dGTP pyrophosphatase MutT (NUDIX family)
LLPRTTACIRDDPGRILLQRRADCGLWGFPGGGQDLGESAAQAVVRETYEETGLRVEPTRLIGVLIDPQYSRTFANGDYVQPVSALFEVQAVGGELRTDSPETLELACFSPDNLPPMLPCCALKASQVLAARRGAFFR